MDFDVLIGTDEISIHALREEGDLVIFFLFLLLPISIHALREEGDNLYRERQIADIEFLSTPSARRATGIRSKRQRVNLFLSTPSARRATQRAVADSSDGRISIHALREEGDEAAVLGLVHLLISIHALREEGDNTSYQRAVEDMHFYPRPPRGGRPSSRYTGMRSPVLFLSTPSARRATRPIPRYFDKKYISIHALREEGDKWS